jgi:hypothetical protein
MRIVECELLCDTLLSRGQVRDGLISKILSAVPCRSHATFLYSERDPRCQYLDARRFSCSSY